MRKKKQKCFCCTRLSKDEICCEKFTNRFMCLFATLCQIIITIVLNPIHTHTHNEFEKKNKSKTRHLKTLKILTWLTVPTYINSPTLRISRMSMSNENIPSIRIIVTPPRDEIPQPCHPSPCGSNAICTERNGAGACACLPDYFGDPYSGCRPECVTNSDCPSHRACLNNKCKDPCPGVCAPNAECRVINHSPQCTCLIGYTGNPLSSCHQAIEPPRTQIVSTHNQHIKFNQLRLNLIE